MFPRLISEMAVRKISINQLSKEMGICSKSLSHKLRGRKEFTRKEMLKIQQIFGGKLTLDELFEWVE